MKNNGIVSRFHRGFGNNCYLHLIFVLHGNQLFPFVIKKIKSYLDREVTLDTFNRFSTGSGLNPAKIEKGKGLN